MQALGPRDINRPVFVALQRPAVQPQVAGGSKLNNGAKRKRNEAHIDYTSTERQPPSNLYIVDALAQIDNDFPMFYKTE